MKSQLFILCNAGLANRLHCIAGAKYIAQHTGRELKVWWPCNHHLNARFSRLFKNTNLQFVHQEDIDNLLMTENRVKFYNCGFNVLKTEVPECYEIMGDDPEEIVCIKSYYTPKFKHLREVTMSPHMVRFIRELDPVDQVNEIVNPYAKLFGYPVVGLHIRYGDYLPGQPGQWDANNVKLYAKSGVSAFELMIDRILDAKPDTKFFVASINAAIEDRLRDRYHPSRIVSQPKVLEGRNSVCGMREAVADMILLSKCRFLIGSDYSQFTLASAELGCIPLVRAGTVDCDGKLTDLIKKL